VTDGLNTIGDNRAVEEKVREEAERRERERLEAERKLLLERARVDFELIGTVAVGIKTDKSEITVGEGITELRRGVFGRNNGFEAITLPKSLEKIGEDVFRDCSVLKRITVHPENPIFESVNNCLIRRSDRTLIAGGKDAIPPDDITAIGKYAFYGRYGLEALKIPCLVSSIGEDAFRGCDKIKTMRFETKRSETWNKSLRKIERGAFIGCTGLGINLSGYGVVCAPGSVDPERVEKWNAESFVTDKTGKYKSVR
jgi:hypothetical protein